MTLYTFPSLPVHTTRNLFNLLYAHKWIDSEFRCWFYSYDKQTLQRLSLRRNCGKMVDRRGATASKVQDFIFILFCFTFSLSHIYFVVVIFHFLENRHQTPLFERCWWWRKMLLIFACLNGFLWFWCLQ